MENKVIVDSDLQEIKVRLRQNTVQKILDLQTYLQTDNKTDALSRAVKLAWNMVNELRAGSRIELHRSNGDVCELLVDDVNR